MKEAGYVYILSNPSFKEDWVKIGKSSRPVDIRSKELDNTAVPLPFEIYATLKTTKYNQVERQLHRMIDRLTNLRIRQNREFFNVAPDQALELLKDCAMTLDDAEIEEYENSLPIDFVANKIKSSEKVNVTANSDTTQLYLKFWDEFVRNSALYTDFVKAFNLRKPFPQHWYDLAIGTSACHICLSVSRQKRRLTAGLYVSNNIQFYNHLIEYKTNIEQDLGRELELREEGKKDRRLLITRAFDIDNSDKENWVTAFEWLYDQSIKLREIVNKYGK